MAFLDPFKHSDDAGYQVVQSLYAIGSGGIAGEGFAKGQAKLFYLPYPYSDFIFSVVGEELGLIGTMAGGNSIRAVALARDKGGSPSPGPPRDAARHRHRHGHNCTGTL